jgi:hypothetical protein
LVAALPRCVPPRRTTGRSSDRQHSTLNAPHVGGNPLQAFGASDESAVPLFAEGAMRFLLLRLAREVEVSERLAQVKWAGMAMAACDRTIRNLV